MSIHRRIAGFVTHYCTLDPSAWVSYSQLHELYLHFERVEYTDQLLTKAQFVRVLGSVPGYRAKKRGEVSGCYGLLIDETAPTHHAERAFELLGSTLGRKQFTPEDISRLARDDEKVASALVQGGCMKTNPRTVRDWLMACRDCRHAGYALRRTFADETNVWRTWRFEKIARK
jgi:hypothetical protein